MIRRFVEPLPRPSMLAPESFWTRSGRTPIPISFLAGALIVLVGLIVGACDRLGGSSVDPAEMPRAPTDVLPDSTAWLVDMDADDQLLSPGTPQQIDPGPRGPAAGDRLQEASLAGRLAGEIASPYGCVMSTPNVGTGSEEGAYRYKATYAFFPEDITREADGQTRTVGVMVASRTLYTAGQREVSYVLRHARCRIPAAEGARAMLRKRIRRLPREAEHLVSKDSRSEEMDKEGTGPARWKGISVSQFLENTGELREPVSKKEACDKVVYALVCDGGTCVWVIVECIMNEATVTAEDPNDSGGGLSDGSDELGEGDSPDGCNADGGPTDQICGGGGTDPVDPIETDTVNNDKRCDGDPLKDMDIRPTCAGVEGGRYGDTRGPNNNQFHGGLDLDADKGTELFAMVGGEIVQVSFLDDFGNYVVVQSSQNAERYFLYAHLSSTAVKEDDTVNEGVKLGETGKSGNADEAECNSEHLHLEVREGDGTDNGWVKDLGGETVDPEEHVGTNFNEEGKATSDSCSPVFKRGLNL